MIVPDIAVRRTANKSKNVCELYIDDVEKWKQKKEKKTKRRKKVLDDKKRIG